MKIKHAPQTKPGSKVPSAAFVEGSAELAPVGAARCSVPPCQGPAALQFALAAAPQTPGGPGPGGGAGAGAAASPSAAPSGPGAPPPPEPRRAEPCPTEPKRPEPSPGGCGAHGRAAHRAAPPAPPPARRSSREEEPAAAGPSGPAGVPRGSGPAGDSSRQRGPAGAARCAQVPQVPQVGAGGRGRCPGHPRPGAGAAAAPLRVLVGTGGRQPVPPGAGEALRGVQGAHGGAAGPGERCGEPGEALRVPAPLPPHGGSALSL